MTLVLNQTSVSTPLATTVFVLILHDNTKWCSCSQESLYFYWEFTQQTKPRTARSTNMELEYIIAGTSVNNRCQENKWSWGVLIEVSFVVLWCGWLSTLTDDFVNLSLMTSQPTCEPHVYLYYIILDKLFWKSGFHVLFGPNCLGVPLVFPPVSLLSCSVTTSHQHTYISAVTDGVRQFTIYFLIETDTIIICTCDETLLLHSSSFLWWPVIKWSLQPLRMKRNLKSLQIKME